MATRNFVPRADQEGKLGTPEKQWYEVNASKINVDGSPVSTAKLAEGTEYEISAKEIAKAEDLLPCFVRNRAGDATIIKANTMLLNYYLAFKELKLYGFDSTKHYKLELFWANAYQPDHSFYRISISESADMADWEISYDSGNKDALTNEIIINENGTTTFDFQGITGYENKRVVAEIDYTKLPSTVQTILSDSEPIFLLKKNLVDGYGELGSLEKAYTDTKISESVITNFDSLEDTPASKISNSLKLLRVNYDETGIEYTSPPDQGLNTTDDVVFNSVTANSIEITGELPTGTLATPPTGLVSGDYWLDTTDSVSHPIVRQKV